MRITLSHNYPLWPHKSITLSRRVRHDRLSRNRDTFGVPRLCSFVGNRGCIYGRCIGRRWERTMQTKEQLCTAGQTWRLSVAQDWCRAPLKELKEGCLLRTAQGLHTQNNVWLDSPDLRVGPPRSACRIRSTANLRSLELFQNNECLDLGLVIGLANGRQRWWCGEKAIPAAGRDKVA